MDGDLELLERWRGGDQGAGQALFAGHFPEIYRFFRHKVGGEADELAQRTFLECARSRDQFRGQSTFRTYLFAIARNQLYRYLRELRRDERLDFDVTSIADLVTTAGTRLERARDAELLRGALRELPLEQQVLLELYYWHDLDATALAEVCGAPAVTIRTKLFRARRALRERLQAGGDGVAALSAGGDRLAASIVGIEAVGEPDRDE